LPRILSVLLVAFLCSCERYPESYPPPEQRHPAEGLNPDGSMVVDLSSGDAQWHVVKDVEPGSPGDQWRWTTGRPTLRILALKTQNVKLKVDFALWAEAFKQTGPVELSFYVNDRLLDKVRYTSPGQKHFEKPIPPDWLATDVESTVAVDIDKLYTAPLDGKKFGFILSSIGFVE
jgi:hypothetical protein